MADVRRLAAAAVAVVALAGCGGEPEVDLDVPARAQGQQVADLAGILEGSDVDARLQQLRADGLDVVAVTYETEQASCGEAYRAGSEVVRAWDADVAVVAVAAPGDFDSTEAASRQRCLGVQPASQGLLSGDVREEIAETLVPPLATDNDWAGAFGVAVDRIAETAAPAAEGS